jgi:hypothetical protein
MKSQIVILSVLILSAFVSGMSLSGCEDTEVEDSQLKKVLKSANCVMNSHVDKIKRGIGHFRGGFWKNFERINGLFVKRKGPDDIDFDEIDVTEEEEIVTMREKREGEENGDEKGEFLFSNFPQKFIKYKFQIIFIRFIFATFTHKIIF